jgi:hypothetical protein
MYTPKTATNSKTVAAPASAAPREKVFPTHTLSIKASVEGAEFQKLTGLWSALSKNGKTYLSTKVNEDITIPAGTTLFVFTNEPKN